MKSILEKLSDTPLVLKGGTALYLGYGLNRFSEDLDFDSSKKLNLLNKIKSAAPQDITINDINVKKDTDTVSRYIINYQVNETGKSDALKLEISYRTPALEDEVVIKNGIRFASLERLIDNKLSAAFDGEHTRSKGRDLFDLHFLAKNYPEHFTQNSALRLQQFAQNPDALFEKYKDSVQDDALLNKIMDTESLALELNEMANNLVVQRQRTVNNTPKL
ncbi:nucleotidyl transferase AbiEii/AbiGii toxin family protein [Lonepinella sp. MS14436]|uniref:nucleotidyl transferase AbiEii/AbiGii toxin family protein n=1 Tax=Lonepinella sp. MS14436 TaxID=3003619 RepID=UPI0036DBC195